MILGATSVVTGFAFVIGALCATIWGPGDLNIVWVWATGGVLLAAPFMTVLLFCLSGAVPFGSMFIRAARWLADSPEDPAARLKPRRMWLLAIPCAYGGALVASILYGTPTKLPGVALGLPFLLDLERAAAVLAAIAAVLVFAVLTSRGLLPTSIGNVVAYEGVRQHELERQVAQLDRRKERRVERLEDRVTGNDDLVAAMGQEILDLRARVDALD